MYEEDRAALLAAREVGLEAELVLVVHDGPGAGDGPRIHLIAGVDEAPAPFIDTRGHLVQHASMQVPFRPERP